MSIQTQDVARQITESDGDAGRECSIVKAAVHMDCGGHLARMQFRTGIGRTSLAFFLTPRVELRFHSGCWGH